MGIQGLLPFLANSTRDAHISEFENEFVAIDAYCWLHKGIYSCAFELAMKKPTTKYVAYCMRYIEMLLHFKVKPILVFDGRHLSSKSETEKKRREERKKKYEKGKELMRAGKVLEGRKLLGESVDITHELALNLIKVCHEKNIDCIVAPYEADSQLAFFSLRNIVKCIITEDSDLLAYGCERVMFKMDTSGRGKLTEKKNIHFSLNMTPEDFNEDSFRYMCILSGCDYLPSLPSIGPANALKFIKMLKDTNIYDALPRLPIYVNKMNVKVTPEYIAGFKIADNTFKHQLVYDPLLRVQTPLRPTNNDDDIVGTKLPDDLAFQLAVGNVDPITMKTLHNFDPDKFGKGFSILWSADFLQKAAPRPVHNSYVEAFEGRKRQRENMETDAVQSNTNDLKKQRIPLSFTKLKCFSAPKVIQKVPKTGFIFEPIVPEENKKVSKLTDSELLRSRYFSRGASKKEEKKEKEFTKDRQKGESYEDYLQRLYNECFPVNDNENVEELKGCSCGKTVDVMISYGSCSSCKKCSECCQCLSEGYRISESQQLGECIRKIEELENHKKEVTEHSILDEINKNEKDKSEHDSASISGAENNQEKSIKELSFSESLSLNFTKILSKLSNKESPENSKVEFPEKENSKVESLEEKDSDVVFVEEQKSVRSPSPVFKLQKETKVLSRNCKLGNISDTASSPTSVYFSSSDSGSLKKSETVSSRRTPSTFRRMPSVKSFNSVPSKIVKSSVKSSAINRTLFQFGFKKERRSEIDPEK